MEFKSFKSQKDLSMELNMELKRISDECLSMNKPFTIALSGGSLPSILSLDFNINNITENNHWRVFYADERCVPIDDPDSNHFLCAKQSVLHGKVHVINNHENPSAAAVDYTDQLKSVFDKEWPEFDLILLGMGPDGHTCSLFPNHPLLECTDKWVECIADSPKPPSNRITMTFPVLNHAKNVIFVCTGDNKKEILNQINQNIDYPAGRVHPINGKLTWFLDDAAASLLKSSL